MHPGAEAPCHVSWSILIGHIFIYMQTKLWRLFWNGWNIILQIYFRYLDDAWMFLINISAHIVGHIYAVHDSLTIEMVCCNFDDCYYMLYENIDIMNSRWYDYKCGYLHQYTGFGLYWFYCNKKKFWGFLTHGPLSKGKLSQKWRSHVISHFQRNLVHCMHKSVTYTRIQLQHPIAVLLRSGSRDSPLWSSSSKSELPSPTCGATCLA
jgi:hypothetical protein